MLRWTSERAPAVGVSFNGYSSSCLPGNRMLLVRAALENGATHVLFLDSDMTLPKDALLRLLAHDKPVVGALCSTRGPMGNRVTGAESFDSTAPMTLRAGETGLRRVEVLGFGVTMIRTTVFDRVPVESFEMRWSPELQAVEGEDFSFFRALKRAGIAAYADMGLSWEVGHIGSVPLGLENVLTEGRK